MPRKATFTITIAPGAVIPQVVTYATRNGTAQAGTHYIAKQGSLTFGLGETSKVVQVDVNDTAEDGLTFYLDGSWQNQGANTISRPAGLCTIGSNVEPVVNYATWFQDLYWMIMDQGYFGPPTGPKALQYPYHAVEKLLVEAPDSGHQSVSETASFWGKLEAWNVILNGTGGVDRYELMWSRVEANFIPAGANQLWGDFNTASPAGYQPEQDVPTSYPVLGGPFPPGAGTTTGDPLAAELQTTYGTKNIYLMHWMIDVDGDYGFTNPDGTTQGVFINSYQRGMQESTWETVTHPENENFANGGGPYGFMPIFNQSLPLYPAAEFPYAKQVRYTVAPDAEARLIQAAYLTAEHAATHSLNVTAQNTKAKKMGDYLRYCLFDKYFHQGAGVDGQGFTGLISWYVSFGMDSQPPATPAWGFRISSSNYHQGYQAPDIAYMMATGGGNFVPNSPTAGDMWLNALNHQLELIRWLQTPQGAIAGGVSNSWKGRYETPTDGRQTNRFHGLYYTYAPEWHDPPSNNWFGFQVWSMERVAYLFLLTTGKSDTLSTDTRNKCQIILDRWINWLLDHASLGSGGAISLPVTLGWTSPTQVVGQTTTVANNEGTFEYLPSLNWTSSGDYGAFWNAATVPNPNLKCNVIELGLDIGSAACAAQVLLHYAQAKRTRPGGSLAEAIPLGSHTVQECLDLAKGILDRIHANFTDTKGTARPELRADYNRFGNTVHIPAGFSGAMPNGDVIQPGVSFIDLRSFMKTWDGWEQVQEYIEGGPVPVFTYHRFWHTTEVAAGYAMLHSYFQDIIYS